MQSSKRVTDVESKLMVTKAGGKTNWEIGIDLYILVCVKKIVRSYCTAQRTLLGVVMT